MPVPRDSHLETITLVLTKGQAKKLRLMAQLRTTPLKRASISDVAREVVEAGLAHVSHASNGSFATSVQPTERVA